jgi:hypothetical protein
MKAMEKVLALNKINIEYKMKIAESEPYGV